jgi:succinyl-diaminopimelate desuccinylase
VRTPPTEDKARVLAALARRRAELARLCAQLVRIPSENPPGDTTRIAAFVERYLRTHGFSPRVYEPKRGMPNIVARLGRGRPNLVLAAHMDEFPAGSGWSFPPFSGTLRRGRILGRGAGDMKAGISIALVTAALLRELPVKLRGSLTLVFASDEETGGTWGTQWLLKHVPAAHGDGCLIGESSGTTAIGVGEKGVLWLRFTARGVSGHAAYALGKSAVRKILKALAVARGVRKRPVIMNEEIAAVIRAQRREAERHWGLGTGRLAGRVTLNIGRIQGGGSVNLIPDQCEVDIDIRLPPGLRTAEIVRFLKHGFHRKDLTDVEVETFNRCESYVTSPKERLVRLVRDNARKLWDIHAIPVVRLGYTDGRFFRRSGVPTVVYGPRVFHMGGPDEYIEEEELFQTSMVHAGAIVDYLGAG